MLKNYLFIGGGNMAKAIITGALNTKTISSEQIFIIDKNQQTHTYFNHLGCNVFFSLDEIQHFIQKISYFILAIKPQDSQEILVKLSALIKHKICVISIMAGITIASLQQYLPYPCVRVMPNTPLLVGMGASALIGYNIDEKQKYDCDKLFSSSGITCWLEQEEQLHAVTALSGSGPAYVFYLLQAMQEIASDLDLPINIARQLICQTFIGTATMGLTQDISFQQMQLQVMSKGGTTEAGINSLINDKVAEKIKDSIQNAYNKSQQMSKII